jgi:hypothetical protein
LLNSAGANEQRHRRSGAAARPRTSLRCAPAPAMAKAVRACHVPGLFAALDRFFFRFVGRISSAADGSRASPPPAPPPPPPPPPPPTPSPRPPPWVSSASSAAATAAAAAARASCHASHWPGCQNEVLSKVECRPLWHTPAQAASAV